MGYGLIFSVYFNEQALFDDLFNYCLLHKNVNDLLDYQMDSSGNTIGQNSVTDADIEIAVALIFADKVWGSTGAINYSQQATNRIAKLKANNIEANSNVVKPGDFWGGATQLRPSNCDTGYIAVIKEFTSDTTWDAVKTKCYSIFAQINTKNSGTGLFPDTTTDTGGNVGYSYDYNYEAVRTVFRIVTDYIWYGSTGAKTQLDLINAFVKNIGASNLKDGYTITGTQISGGTSNTFICSHTAGMLALTTDVTTAQSFFTLCKNTKDTTNSMFYGNSIRLFALLLGTGNMPNLLTYTPAPPPPPPPPTPSSTYPFNAVYPFGTSSLTTDTTIAAFITTEWNDWKASHVTAAGAGGF